MKTQTKATEQRNPRTRGLDKKSTLNILRTIHREDATVIRAVAQALPAIARAVDAIVPALERGGRLIYVGAGTSGRIATLDAAEIPPTFGTPGRMVQSIIAGGRPALTRAMEGAEDNRRQGALDLARRKLSGDDVVVGIAASGSTPYVLGALEFARSRGAITVGVTSDPRTPITRLVKISIVTPTGPEAITGSTRMKAGTAQKMVLNMLSTAVMVRMGRTYDNWMMGVAPTNQKLRERGLRILAEATGSSVERATQALRQLEHDAKKPDLCAALLMIKTGASVKEARRMLASSKGNLHTALLRGEQISKQIPKSG